MSGDDSGSWWSTDTGRKGLIVGVASLAVGILGIIVAFSLRNPAPETSTTASVPTTAVDEANPMAPPLEDEDTSKEDLPEDDNPVPDDEAESAPEEVEDDNQPEEEDTTEEGADSSQEDEHEQEVVEEDPDPITATAPTSIFLSALEPNNGRVTTGNAVVAGNDYPQSITHRFSNCSSCTWSVEYNLRREWTTFTATIGLTDDSRADETIDGLQTFTVYLDEVPIDSRTLRRGTSEDLVINVTDGLFLRLEVGEGTNFETAVWGNARLG